MEKLIKGILVAAVGFLVCTASMAQHKPQNSLYVLNNFLINPAIAGIEEYSDVKLGYRSQWMGVEGAPETFYISGHTSLFPKKGNKPTGGNPRKKDHTPFGSKERMHHNKNIKAHHGFGATIMGDKTGAFRRTNIELAYAYHLPVAEGLALSLGFSGGMINDRLDTDNIIVIDESDNILAGGTLSNSAFQMGMGTWLYSNHFYFGLSVSQLLKEETYYLESSGEELVDDNINYYATAAYRFDLNEDVFLSPFVMLKNRQPSPLSLDVGVKALFNGRFWGGLAFRNSETLVAMAGLYVNQNLEVSYSYDGGPNELDRLSGGTSEIMIGFRFGNKAKLFCPENFW